MVPEKRKLMVVGAAIAAAFAMTTGCAPTGYNAADYGAEPAANAVDATASPTATPGAETEDDAAEEGSTGDSGADAPELSDDEVTSELSAVDVKRMGTTVQNQDGFVLYRFDSDKVKPEVVSNCYDDCEKVWPPVVTNGEKPKLKGIDPADVGFVTRKDGTKQVTIGKWPVYTYIGDKKKGQWSGQNVGGKWFVVEPDGTKNLTCLPAVSKAVAPPKDDAEGDAEDSGGDAGGDSAGSDYSY